MTEIRVLLADDHQIVLDGITYLLEKNPREQQGAASPFVIKVVGTAHDGEEVLELMKKVQVDVAVLDISMPKLDGLDTARQIGQLYPATKTILLTMQGDGRYVLNALSSGVKGYVVKEKKCGYPYSGYPASISGQYLLLAGIIG